MSTHCSTRSLHSACKEVEQFPACVNSGNSLSYRSLVIVSSNLFFASYMHRLVFIKTSRGGSNADFWNILFAYLPLHILTVLEFPNFDLCVFNHCGGQTLWVSPSCAMVWKVLLGSEVSNDRAPLICFPFLRDHSPVPAVV